MRTPGRFALSTFVACVVAVAGCGGPPAPHVARDPALRDLPLYFYPPSDSARPPRAFVFFFGNDVGFWQPHRELAASMASDDYAVTGFDMRDLLRSLPNKEPARDSAFAERIAPIIAASRRELGADSLPLILAGHSLGAEVAIWAGAHARLPRLAGVLSLSPGSRSHLRVSVSDVANSSEPEGAGSFAVADAVRALPPAIHLAILRGSSDKYQFADSALLAAAGPRAQRFVIPLAGHSLRNLILARGVVRRALDWILESPSPR